MSDFDVNKVLGLSYKDENLLVLPNIPLLSKTEFIPLLPVDISNPFHGIDKVIANDLNDTDQKSLSKEASIAYDDTKSWMMERKAADMEDWLSNFSFYKDLTVGGIKYAGDFIVNIYTNWNKWTGEIDDLTKYGLIEEVALQGITANSSKVLKSDEDIKLPSGNEYSVLKMVILEVFYENPEVLKVLSNQDNMTMLLDMIMLRANITQVVIGNVNFSWIINRKLYFKSISKLTGVEWESNKYELKGSEDKLKAEKKKAEEDKNAIDDKAEKAKNAIEAQATIEKATIDIKAEKEAEKEAIGDKAEKAKKAIGDKAEKAKKAIDDKAEKDKKAMYTNVTMAGMKKKKAIDEKAEEAKKAIDEKAEEDKKAIDVQAEEDKKAIDVQADKDIKDNKIKAIDAQANKDKKAIYAKANKYKAAINAKISLYTINHEDALEKIKKELKSSHVGRFLCKKFIKNTWKNLPSTSLLELAKTATTGFYEQSIRKYKRQADLNGSVETSRDLILSLVSAGYTIDQDGVVRKKDNVILDEEEKAAIKETK